VRSSSINGRSCGRCIPEWRLRTHAEAVLSNDLKVDRFGRAAPFFFFFFFVFFFLSAKATWQGSRMAVAIASWSTPQQVAGPLEVRGNYGQVLLRGLSAASPPPRRRDPDEIRFPQSGSQTPRLVS